MDLRELNSNMIQKSPYVEIDRLVRKIFCFGKVKETKVSFSNTSNYGTAGLICELVISASHKELEEYCRSLNLRNIASMAHGPDLVDSVFRDVSSNGATTIENWGITAIKQEFHQDCVDIFIEIRDMDLTNFIAKMKRMGDVVDGYIADKAIDEILGRK